MFVSLSFWFCLNWLLQHLDTFVCEPLPKRSTNQQLRVSSLQQVLHVDSGYYMLCCISSCNMFTDAGTDWRRDLQRAWLLKLVALELHLGDMDVVVHRDSCRRLLSRLFLREPAGWETGMPSNLMPARLTLTNTDSSIHKIKVSPSHFCQIISCA